MSETDRAQAAVTHWWQIAIPIVFVVLYVTYQTVAGMSPAELEVATAPENPPQPIWVFEHPEWALLWFGLSMATVLIVGAIAVYWRGDDDE